MRPWDPQTDLFQYESNFKIMTKAKHNLKLSSHCLANPRSSLLTLHHHHHHQTPHLIQHRHHQIVPNVVESNEYIGMFWDFQIKKFSWFLILKFNKSH